MGFGLESWGSGSGEAEAEAEAEGGGGRHTHGLREHGAAHGPLAAVLPLRLLRLQLVERSDLVRLKVRGRVRVTVRVTVTVRG